MKSAADIIAAQGLQVSDTIPGRYYSLCPKCSAGRKTIHQTRRCVGVTIDDKGVKWGCNNCNWRGGAYYEGRSNGRANGAGPHIVKTYDYINAEGKLLYQVCRYEPKDFRQRRPGENGRGWIWNMQGIERVPYRLPETIEAIANQHRVIICEGEKDAETLWAIGVPATCNAGGAGKWRDEYDQHFRDADVVIIPDNDQPGRDHARDVAGHLHRVAARVSIVHIPDEAKDISDWLAAGHTREDVDALIEHRAKHNPEAEANEEIPHKDRTEVGSELQFDRLSDIEPEAIAWIWPGRIARRKLTLLAGDPGMGKSQIGIDIGARITKGGNWPDGGVAPLGSVIVLSAEDSTADTVRPRFEAAEANLDRVQVLRAVIEKGKRRTFNLQKDLAALANKVTAVGDVTFVIIDPITAYMGKVDGHQTTDVRSVLEPVADFADKSNVAVLGITHPPKNAPVKAINAFTGSLAYVAVARTVFIAIDEPETERRLLIAVKNNLGPLAPGLGYRLEQTILANNIVPSRIAWDSAPVAVTANEALAASAEGARNSSALTEAKEFLQEELVNGPVPQADIKKRAQDADISWITLKRAKKALQVIAAKGKGSLTGSWTWELPQNARRGSSEGDHSPH
jgi:putative DNA primase/helicase